MPLLACARQRRFSRNVTDAETFLHIFMISQPDPSKNINTASKLGNPNQPEQGGIHRIIPSCSSVRATAANFTPHALLHSRCSTATGSRWSNQSQMDCAAGRSMDLERLPTQAHWSTALSVGENRHSSPGRQQLQPELLLSKNKTCCRTQLLYHPGQHLQYDAREEAQRSCSMSPHPSVVAQNEMKPLS